MGQFLQQLINGTVNGSVYGLIALGYTMVYGIIQLINFAHGEVFMVGAFAGLAAYTYVIPDSMTGNQPLCLVVVLLAAILVSTLTAVLLERLAYRPLRNAPRLAPLITAIGMSLVLQELIRLYYPKAKSTRGFPSGRLIPDGSIEVAGVTIAWQSIFAVAVSLVLMVALDRFVNGTRIGKAMRATAQDPDTARLMGIDTNRIIVLTFAIGGALAGIAGVIDGIHVGAVQFNMGFLAGIKAFTAAVLGGIGNIRGAMLGGFTIGLIEAMAAQYLPGSSSFASVWVFVVLIAVLTFRPEGFLGERVGGPGVNRAGAQAAVLSATRRLVGDRSLPFLVAGAALTIAGTLGPWASFFFGFPGKVTLPGFPGGARVFVLMLAVLALVGALPLPGRRRAALAAATGAGAATVLNLVAIANDGGGLGALSWGIWMALVGSLVLVAGAAALPDDQPVAAWPTLPATVEVGVIAAALGGTLALVWWGLDIEESSRFASYGVFVTAASLAAARLGLFEWLVGASERHRAVTIGAAGLAAAAFPFTQGGDGYWLRVFASIGVFAAAAIGLNVVVGLAGLLDLGYVAFFGVGAYVGALFGGARLTTLHVHLPFLLVVFLGASIAALFGLLLGAPTLRLRGDYLAIVTLGFGEIFRISVNQLDDITRGPNGIADIPNLAIGGFDFGEGHKVLGVDLPYFANYYMAELVLLAAVILIFTRLDSSRIGRAWVAIREDETAAAAMGVNTTRMKLLAFAIGAFLAGAAGTVNAHVGRQVSPDSYEFEQSVLFVAAVVLGGMGTVPGALIGSSILFILPEKLRAFSDKRFLIFGAALVLMMRFRPEGIAPSRRRRRELHTPEAPPGVDAVPVP